MAGSEKPGREDASPPSDRWTLVRWRLWYARMLRTYRTTSAEEILLSWLVRMPPNVWRLGSQPTAADQERWPGRYLLTPDECWGPHELADEQLEALRAQYAQIPSLANWESIPLGAIVGKPGFAFGTPPSSVIVARPGRNRRRRCARRGHGRQSARHASASRDRGKSCDT